jgi:hypothetical protein
MYTKEPAQNNYHVLATVFDIVERVMLNYEPPPKEANDGENLPRVQSVRQ